MDRSARGAGKRGPPAPRPGGKSAGDGLTGIPPRIHLAATNEGGDQADERDEIVVDAFLDTLARIALAVASRISRSEEGVDG